MSNTIQPLSQCVFLPIRPLSYQEVQLPFGLPMALLGLLTSQKGHCILF